ncbi:hypothetical protein BofuT4_P107630.1 [Botrytis cinerea T4]|uniref:Uncharacterized protein n=1 Tax=Botryotinia fuckeliana (strain T4) TaxID=999810 RepID=G2Y6X7_BOTF4|nr:hypothetical protein BofuT4_P107630.1 [Botrytis cinerea T4]
MHTYPHPRFYTWRENHHVTTSKESFSMQPRTQWFLSREICRKLYMLPEHKYAV